MFEYICVCTYIHTSTRALAHPPPLHTHIHTYTHTHIHTQVLLQRIAHRLWVNGEQGKKMMALALQGRGSEVRACVRESVCVCVCVCVYYMYISPHTQQHMHTHAHTHTHTQVFGVDAHPGAVIKHAVMLDHATGVVIGEVSMECASINGICLYKWNVPL